jgi:hypothetical protein
MKLLRQKFELRPGRFLREHPFRDGVLCESSILSRLRVPAFYGGRMTSLYEIRVSVRIRWWLRFYLMWLVWMCRISRLEPNWARVHYWLRRGVVVKIEVER